MKNFDIKKLNFEKMNGLLPAIIQDDQTKQILMFGYMNEESLKKTIQEKLVTFYSRTKKRLWTKGEESGNFLNVIEIIPDCDNDTLLVMVEAPKETCHLGNYSCFKKNKDNYFILRNLFELIENRKKEMPKDSYTTSLFKEGRNKIAQKIGEEASEVIVAALKESNERLVSEASDLLFHLFTLLVDSNISFDEILEELNKRRK